MPKIVQGWCRCDLDKKCVKPDASSASMEVSPLNDRLEWHNLHVASLSHTTYCKNVMHALIGWVGASSPIMLILAPLIIIILIHIRSLHFGLLHGGPALHTNIN